MNSVHPHASEIKYIHDYVNTCCFSSMVLALFYNRRYVSEQAIASRLISYLICEYFGYKYSIRFISYVVVLFQECK